MQKKFENILSYLIIIIGALLASFSVVCILIPNDAIDYGTSGIAIIISKLSGLNLSICVLLTFLPFWIIGIKRLGKTCTLMNSYGMIAGENKTVICYVNYFELQKMKEIISRNKESFSTVTTVDEILQ